MCTTFYFAEAVGAVSTDNMSHKVTVTGAYYTDLHRLPHD